MTVEEYISTFRMDQENYEFSREEFIQELKKEFLEKVAALPIPEGKKVPYYVDFKKVVKEMQEKFWKISFKKPGKNLTKALWGAFFAMVVVDTRRGMYPIVQAKIDSLNRCRDKETTKANIKGNKSHKNKTGQNG